MWVGIINIQNLIIYVYEVIINKMISIIKVMKGKWYIFTLLLLYHLLKIFIII